MSGRYKRTYFGFLPQDYKAVGPWLEGMAAEGWALDRLSRFPFFTMARFRPLERADLRYCVDLGDSSLSSEEAQAAYRALCADAGWNFVGAAEGMVVYQNQPGTRPIPIQTDGPMERRRFRRRVLTPTLIVLAVVVLLLPILLAVSGRGFPSLFHTLFSSNYRLAEGLAMLLTLAGLLLLWLHALIYWRRSRAATESGESMPAPSVRAARRRGLLSVAANLLLPFFLFFSMWSVMTDPARIASGSDALSDQALLGAEELGGGWTYSLWGYMDDSLLMEWAQIYQQGNQRGDLQAPRLDQEIYRCRFPWVADLMVADLMVADLMVADLMDGNPQHRPGFVPADLGFDESYTGADGALNLLLLRQGGTVVLLTTTFDPAQLLPLVRARLIGLP